VAEDTEACASLSADRRRLVRLANRQPLYAQPSIFRARHFLFAPGPFPLRGRFARFTLDIMKKLLSAVFTIATCFVSCHDHTGVHAAPLQESGQAKIAGKWQMSMETPHGVVKGPFSVQQEGAKLTTTFEAEMFGTVPGTGTVDGNKVSFSLSIPNGPQFGFSGTVDGSKMSGKTEMDGTWSATREGGQTAPQKNLLGTVTDFRVNALEMALKLDDGKTEWVKFSAATEVMLAAPGEKDLTHAQPARVADIARDDRVMVSFVDGMAEARRIVVVAATAIARRNAAERLDWEKRGMTGVVAARDEEQITLENRTPQGAQRITVAVTHKTAIRRYAPDSVKFADAEPAKISQIAVGDQIRVRGDKNEDGSRITADNVVFGTFLTTLGTVSEVNHEKGELKIVDLTSKKPMVVRLTADTRVKKMPEMRQMPAGHGESQAVNMAQVLQQLPAGSVDDLKAGTSVVVTSTRGAKPDRVTGIMVIANVDALIKMAQEQANGASPMEALNKMHGGMLSGPGGVSLPAILQ